jgi:hypothetical protein
MELPIYKAILKETDQIELISLVENPAIETDFVAFSDETMIERFESDEKQMVIGPAMIPNKMIYRKSQFLGDFYTYFSKEEIEKIQYQYAKDLNFNKSNLNHNLKLENIIMLESWIIEDKEKDKSLLYGFDLPIGTWMVKYKIDNPDVWKKIKSKEIKGFSIEGYLSYQFEKIAMNKQEKISDLTLDILSNKKK